MNEEERERGMVNENGSPVSQHSRHSYHQKVKTQLTWKRKTTMMRSTSSMTDDDGGDDDDDVDAALVNVSVSVMEGRDWQRIA